MRNGFTVIELAIVLSIIALMALLMIPPLGQWVDTFRIKQAGRCLVSDLQLAKIKAMSTGRYCTVTFNITVDGSSYSYIVFDDTNSNCEYDAGEEVFRRLVISDDYKNVTFDTSQAEGDGITFADNDHSRPSVSFDSRGFPRDNAGGFGAGSVYLIHAKNAEGRQVLVSSNGRVRIQRY